MRRALLHNNGNEITPEYTFDLDENSSFLIRRESDNVEQTFTYAEVIDGTYDTFISGSNGAVKEWQYLGQVFANYSDNSLQPRLFSNSGSPYVYDYTQGGHLNLSKTLDLRGDWIVTLISANEENPNNQRVNLSIRDDYGKAFVLQFNIYGQSFFYVDPVGSNFSNSISFPDNNSTTFKLWTFERKSGVLRVLRNNVLVTLGSLSSSCTDLNSSNNVRLGDRGDGVLGKINKYKHLSLLTGVNATNTDTSAYNLAIMSKYGI